MYEYRGLLKRVIDGDTIDVFLDLGFNITVEYRLRIADVDTPELRARDKTKRKAAQAAKKFVEDLLANSVLMVSTRKTSKGKERTTFGRYVADVRIVKTTSVSALGLATSTQDLAEELVKAGHGKYV